MDKITLKLGDDNVVVAVSNEDMATALQTFYEKNSSNSNPFVDQTTFPKTNPSDVNVLKSNFQTFCDSKGLDEAAKHSYDVRYANDGELTESELMRAATELNAQSAPEVFYGTG
mmetsp:Transcript_11903/g.23897  ORF Transcript_11903/g.23897 Transcript_11903/m.23897 type:complete len:114 (-) Transcript_11903:1175-1516(-)